MDDVQPVISIRTFLDEESGKYGVELIVACLDSQQQADNAVAFLQRQLCGDAVTVN